MKNVWIYAGLALALIACGDEKKEASVEERTSSESEVNAEETDSTNLPSIEDEESNEPVMALPSSELVVRKDMDFEVEDTILIQEFDDNLVGIATVEIYMTEDLEVVMGVSNIDGLYEDWWTLEVGDVGAWSTGFEASLSNVCGNDDEELVLWWDTSEGHSGFYEGYEMSRSGIMILDVHTMKAYLDFTYNDHYMSYEAPDDADEEGEEEEHGKMNEDSRVEMCSYYMDLVLDKRRIVVSNYELTVEDSPDCDVIQVAEGVYEFNDDMEAFVGPVH